MRSRKKRIDDIENLIEAYAVGNPLLIGWEKVLKRTTKAEFNDYIKGIGCDQITGDKRELITHLAKLTCPSEY
ncbi:hypothetical protein SMGD1_0847 [Sulfurimonas gotlandica GD1]|uniref:Uncharacterized protein n=1 Tax=Sulfurimonas gotlandica (strain DSM 19862 / JCM 16533 / GD1) TaxID=929558 RepID=H1FX64_SULGG|nr:hypothetical protein [Sulfurimonas gotlandica]EHP29374.1 hypothetical protein SMGD1_0847 [Sulfurimonas gotlandica GD1]